MAVGKAGEAADRDRLSIWFGDILVADGRRARAELRRGDRRALHEGRARSSVRVDLGIGAGRATVWTCDLTHGYIDINAYYRS